MMYRDAKDKNEQIKILSDLNMCDSGTIIDVLSKNGFVPGLPKKKAAEKQTKYKRPNTAFRFTDEQAAEIERLYAGGMKSGEIAEKLGFDYKTVSNKISNMSLPEKYNRDNRKLNKPPKREKTTIDADRLYIQTLEEELTAKDEKLKSAVSQRDAYKIELDKLMEENELLREADKYRDDLDGVYNALKDARLLIDLVLVTASGEDDSATYHGLVRANEIITSAMCELQ